MPVSCIAFGPELFHRSVRSDDTIVSPRLGMISAITSSITHGIKSAFSRQLSWAPVAVSTLHTKLLHSTVTRDPSYSIHNEDDVEFFKSVLGARGVLEDAAALEPMNR